MPFRIQSGLRVRPNAGSRQYSHAFGPPLAEQRLDATKVMREDGWMRCKEGPWGEIEYRFVYLEASTHVIQSIRLPGSETRWEFPGMSPAQVCAFLEKCGVPGEWIAAWSSPGRMAEQGGVTQMLPVNDHVENLSPSVRVEIFRELARHEENPFHFYPVVIAGGDNAGFFRDAGIRGDIVRRLERMCYHRGGAVCFSDVQVLIACAENELEARRFYKLCTRTRAIIARLNVTPATDIAALARYWSVSHRTDDIVPLLQSVAEIPSSLDLIHMLPPLARKCLNSYPSLEMGIRGRMPDCHWTSLNFFNHEPHEIYLDLRLTSSYIEQNFEEAERPWRLGDVFLFVSDDGTQAMHSCVFIADDIVFTKNGGAATRPWTLSRLKDLEEIYQVGTGFQIKPMRRKRALEGADSPTRA